MKRTMILTLTISAVLSLASTAPVLAQDFLFDVDSINFGDVGIGLGGLPEGNRSITIQNLTGSPQQVSIVFSDVPNPEDFALIDDSIAVVRKVLRDISDAAGCYLEDYWEDPRSVAELVQKGYLTLDVTLLLEWDFSLIGSNPITQIEAFKGGTDLEVLYDLQSGRFSGTLSESKLQGSDLFELRSGDQSFILVFNPSSEEEVSGSLKLVLGDRETSLPISGSGIIKPAISLSETRFALGGAYLGRYVSRELTITNTSDITVYLDFDFSDSSRFFIFESDVKVPLDYIFVIEAACRAYIADRGWAPSWFSLINYGYLAPDSSILENWSFRLHGVGNEISYIEARPNFESLRGIGYNVRTKSIYGDGVANSGHRRTLGADQVKSYQVAFLPNSEEIEQESVRIRAYAQTEHDEQEYTLQLSGTGMDVSDAIIPILPTCLSLSPPFPSPFNSTTIVSYSTPQFGAVNATLVDVSGREWTKWTGLQAGQGRIAVDGTGLATGEYWLRVEQNGKSATTRLILLR